MHMKVYLHTHTRGNGVAHVLMWTVKPSRLSPLPFSFSSGPIFSPIKPVIALGNKESINPVSANKTTLVWQEAAFLVADNMLWVFAWVGITYYKKKQPKQIPPFETLFFRSFFLFKLVRVTVSLGVCIVWKQHSPAPPPPPLSPAKMSTGWIL